MAAVNSVRLGKRVRESMQILLEGVRYFTDSLAVLGILRTESGKFNKFVHALVSEEAKVKDGSHVYIHSYIRHTCRVR